MVPLIFAMLLCIVLAVAVVGLVAIPARRQGRDLLTPKGEAVVSRVRVKAGTATSSVRAKGSRSVSTARDDAGEANPGQTR